MHFIEHFVRPLTLSHYLFVSCAAYGQLVLVFKRIDTKHLNKTILGAKLLNLLFYLDQENLIDS